MIATDATDPVGKRVLLLRGINVGGHRKLAMADLRTMLTDLGFRDATTYIQSGNAVVSDGPHDAASVVRAGLAERFGLADVAVVERSLAQLANARQSCANHFPSPASDSGHGAHLKRVHVVFLAPMPPPQRRASLRPGDFGDDRFHLEIHDRVADLYVDYAVGAGTSKLTTDRIERAFGVTATARNLNTLDRLITMATARNIGTSRQG
jgi:uncharacterized protein (DUF1697 family)